MDGNKWLVLKVSQYTCTSATWAVCIYLHDEYINGTGIFDFDCISCLKAVISAIYTKVEGIGAVWEPAKAD